MSGNYNSLYKNARRHLRKTKEKMIQPFDREVGKKGAPIDAGKKITKQKKEEVYQKLKQQRFKEKQLNIILVLVTFGLVFFAVWMFGFDHFEQMLKNSRGY